LEVKNSFGFAPNLSLSSFHNAVNLRKSSALSTSALPLPSNMAYHDLTSDQSAPPDAKSLLGLGSKFIPKPKLTTGDILPSFDRLERDFHIKVHFAGDIDERFATRDASRSKLIVKSIWKPSTRDIPNWCSQRLSKFFTRAQRLFKRRKAKSNLTPCQESLLETLPDDPRLLFPETDKGLGPCAVEYDQYVEDCLIHLKNSEVYQQLSEEEAFALAKVIQAEISDWLKRHKGTIGDQAFEYITDHLKSNESSPFGQFYVLYKIHKGKKNGRWPTRPVCSDVSSLPHGLGKWVTEMLTPIQQAQLSYFRDSFVLKDILDKMRLPPNALLFTSDATSMYTNIKTTPALEEVSKFLRNQQHTFGHYDRVALTEALHLVFRNNILKFGDTFWRQISGTAMGTPPAPPWATVTYALHENEMLPRWQDQVHFYKRFIDDVIGVWLLHPDPSRNQELWDAFCADMNGWHGLEWECTTPSTTINFMDLTITIIDGKLETTLFEKAENLYLYIPPHSSHPRGVFTGLVYGQVLRIRRLCSKSTDADNKINEFLSRLMARGHTFEDLAPLFHRAEENAKAYLSRSPEEVEALKQKKWEDSHNQVFFHLQFHPDDPPSRDIQRLWQEYVFAPPGEQQLPEMENLDGNAVGINKLVVAYSRPLNLKNRFSVRDIHGRGRPVSEYLAE
jgi:hypothetical protein